MVVTSDRTMPTVIACLVEGGEGWGIDLMLSVTMRQGDLTNDGRREMQALLGWIASKELDTLELLQDQLEAEGKFITRAAP